MNIDLTPLFQAIVTVLVALITYKVIPWLKAKLNESQYALLMATTKVLVYAAEQMQVKGLVVDKLQYVKGELKARGFDVDLDAIEAMVRTLSIEQEAQVLVAEAPCDELPEN